MNRPLAAAAWSFLNPRVASLAVTCLACVCRCVQAERPKKIALGHSSRSPLDELGDAQPLARRGRASSRPGGLWSQVQVFAMEEQNRGADAVVPGTLLNDKVLILTILNDKELETCTKWVICVADLSEHKCPKSEVDAEGTLTNGVTGGTPLNGRNVVDMIKQGELQNKKVICFACPQRNGGKPEAWMVQAAVLRKEDKGEPIIVLANKRNWKKGTNGKLEESWTVEGDVAINQPLGDCEGYGKNGTSKGSSKEKAGGNASAAKKEAGNKSSGNNESQERSRSLNREPVGVLLSVSLTVLFFSVLTQ